MHPTCSQSSPQRRILLERVIPKDPKPKSTTSNFENAAIFGPGLMDCAQRFESGRRLLAKEGGGAKSKTQFALDFDPLKLTR